MEKKNNYPKEVFDEFVKYMRESYPDHKRKKDGNPNMLFSENRKIWKEYIIKCKREIDERQQKKRQNENTKYVRNLLESEKPPEFECVICYDNITSNVCRLDCSHMYCVKCLATHMRVSGNCPMCRATVLDPPRKNVIIPDEAIDAIVDSALNTRYVDRCNRTFSEFLAYNIRAFYGENRVTEPFVNVIMREINQHSSDIMVATSEWHNSRI